MNKFAAYLGKLAADLPFTPKLQGFQQARTGPAMTPPPKPYVPSGAITGSIPNVPQTKRPPTIAPMPRWDQGIGGTGNHPPEVYAANAPRPPQNKWDIVENDIPYADRSISKTWRPPITLPPLHHGPWEPSESAARGSFTRPGTGISDEIVDTPSSGLTGPSIPMLTRDSQHMQHPAGYSNESIFSQPGGPYNPRLGYRQHYEPIGGSYSAAQPESVRYTNQMTGTLGTPTMSTEGMQQTSPSLYRGLSAPKYFNLGQGNARP